MLSREGCRSRRNRLWNALACDAILLSDPNSLIRYANFSVSPFVFQASSCRGFLLLSDAGQTTLVRDNQARPFAANAWFDQEVVATFYEGKASAPRREPLQTTACLQTLLDLKPKRLGVEAATVPWAILGPLQKAIHDLELIDIDSVIRQQRRSKDQDELGLLRKSIKAIDAGMDTALERLRPGMTEYDAYHIVQRAAWDSLGDQAVVYGDFASNSNGDIQRRGGPPTDRVIQSGDLFILDFSVIVHGYRGDFANTFVVGQPASSGQKALFETSLHGLAVAESMLRPGVAGKDIDRAAREAMAKRSGGDYFPSHMGHGIGLNHLEPPFIVPESSDTLEVGDVITLEPGQYVQGVGGMRFERNYLITADGFETLSNHKIALEQS